MFSALDPDSPLTTFEFGEEISRKQQDKVPGATGCSSVWQERLPWEQEVVGSNPVAPTTSDNPVAQSGMSTALEVEVVGSNPTSRIRTTTPVGSVHGPVV